MASAIRADFLLLQKKDRSIMTCESKALLLCYCRFNIFLTFVLVRVVCYIRQIYTNFFEKN